jgi:hypothetical protein
MSRLVQKRRATGFIVVLVFLVGPMAWGKTPASKLSAGGGLPQFVLADPDGNKHPNSELAKAGLVLVLLATEDIQPCRGSGVNHDEAQVTSL